MRMVPGKRMPSRAVFLKRYYACESAGGSWTLFLHSINHIFWFSKSGVGSKSLHFSQVPQWCQCSWSTGPTLNSQNLEEWFSNLSVHQDHSVGLLKPRLLGPTPRISDSVCPGWGLIMCLSNLLPCGARAASSRIKHLRVYVEKIILEERASPLTR